MKPLQKADEQKRQSGTEKESKRANKNGNAGGKRKQAGNNAKKTQSEAEKDLDRSGNEPTGSARKGGRKGRVFPAFSVAAFTGGSARK